MVGNRPMVKVDEKVSIVCEQFYRLMIDCGMPAQAADVMHGTGLVCNELMLRTMPRMTLFTGSQQVADKLTSDMKGRVKLEDAGFDWKILGPDVAEVEYVAWQCDQDAYALSGQKCSAQSMMFAHSNWMTEEVDLVNKLADRAVRCLF
jgi:1-pyrroline-5-carboxylate dehydrogenase